MNLTQKQLVRLTEPPTISKIILRFHIIGASAVYITLLHAEHRLTTITHTLLHT